MITTRPPDTYTLSRFLDLELDPPGWLVEGLIPSYGLIALASAPKVGKSMFAMHLARALAAGDDFLGLTTPAPARTLYVAEEGGMAHIQGRFARLETSGYFGPCAVDPLLAIHPQLTVDTEEGIARFAALLKVTRPALVVIDCLVWVHSQSENRSEEMTALMGNLRRLAAEHDCAILFIHHTAKARDDRTGYSMRGSGVLASATEANLSLRRVRGGVRLDVELREGEGHSLRLVWDGEAGVFRLADDQSTRGTDGIDVERYLEGVPQATVKQMADHFGVSDTAIRARLNAAAVNDRVVSLRTGRGRELIYRLRAA